MFTILQGFRAWSLFTRLQGCTDWSVSVYYIARTKDWSLCLPYCNDSEPGHCLPVCKDSQTGLFTRLQACKTGLYVFTILQGFRDWSQFTRLQGFTHQSLNVYQLARTEDWPLACLLSVFSRMTRRLLSAYQIARILVSGSSFKVFLTHLSLASHKRDISKQCRPRHLRMFGSEISTKHDEKKTSRHPL